MHPEHPHDASPHTLLEGLRSPGVFFIRFLRVRPEEVSILLWVTAIQVTMSISSVLINNLSQATFLKRFGVGYLPVVFLVEAVVTFLVANAVGVLMSRYRTLRVFTVLLGVFAAVGIAFRLLIPLGQEILYPALYVFKSMAIGVLPILYWDLVSDLFTTQQGKRLYTLITAGGILGTTAGSLMTGRLSRWLGMDNVLWVFAAGMILAALLNENTERVLGGPLEPRVDRKPKGMRSPFGEEVRAFVGYARQSALLKIMILLIAIPNVILPVLTYQFNVAVDAYFATEQGTVDFFGMFRGVSNAVVFAALMVSSRLVTRWGVPTTLLIHPFNYLISFGALFFHFQLLTAVYARFSTELFKSTLNNPARSILYNFFPQHMRSMIRVFLRGNVVRAADFAGSGLLLLAVGMVDPRFLSLITIPLVFIWLLTGVRLKRTYPALLIQSLAERRIDWKGMSDEDFQAWFRDRKTMENLFQGLRSSVPSTVLACGEILARGRPKGWAEALVAVLPGTPPRIQASLLNLLSAENAPSVRETLFRMTEGAPPEILASLLRTLSRIAPLESAPAMRRWVGHEYPAVREEALVGLHADPESDTRVMFTQNVSELLGGGEGEKDLALRILGRTGDEGFEDILLDTVRDPAPRRRGWSLTGLGLMRHPRSLDLALHALEDPAPEVRRAVVKALQDRRDEGSLAVLVRLLDDNDAGVRIRAAEAVRKRGPDAVKLLLAAMAHPSRDMREQALTLLQEQGLPRVEVSRFSLETLETAYRQVACIQALDRDDHGCALGFLLTHLRERTREASETVLRILGAIDFQDRRNVILKAIHSPNQRDVDDALEALEVSIHPDLRRLVIPLFRDIPPQEQLALAGARFREIETLARATPEEILERLLVEGDPSTRILAVYALQERPRARDARPQPWERLIEHTDPLIRDHAGRIRRAWEEGVAASHGLPADLELLQRIPIFQDLSVADLLALALASEPLTLAAESLLIHENDPGDALYLVRAGELSVVKSAGSDREHVLARVGPGEFIGELALIDRAPRSASVRTETEVELLTLRGDAFTRLMERRPDLTLHVCRALVQRIRRLEESLSRDVP